MSSGATLFIAASAIAAVQPASAASVWILLIACGSIAAFAFVSLLLVTRQSKKAVAKEVAQRLAALKTLVTQSNSKIRRLDQQIIDQLRNLSTRGQQGFNMLKQIISVLEKRIVDVEKLLATQRMEDVFKAHAMLLSEVDNVGNGIDNLIFSENVLSLKPDQFEFAVDMMFAAVEADLARRQDESGHQPVFHIPRKRRFTIRGFLKVLGGES